MMQPVISIVVVTFNMNREAPRTIYSLSPAMQRGISSAEYEIIVVDNGSDENRTDYDLGNAKVTFLDVANPTKSPAAALNLGIRVARGRVIGAMIDGARMVSPGLLASVADAIKLHPRAIVSPLGFHLGEVSQNQSVAHGYCQAVEDQLMESVNWKSNGYKLFDVSVIAPGNRDGLTKPLPEATALFMSRSLWDEVGGFDERFHCAGGGLVNLDTYRRACELGDVKPICILGEGTFHQVHGGVASNSIVHPWPEFHEEYVLVRGKKFEPPKHELSFYVSKLNPRFEFKRHAS
jgi:glycosyltransferase involved in cell wall biosynthesis